MPSSCGVAGNAAFFANAKNPRSLAALNKEIQSAFSALGLLRRRRRSSTPSWDYAQARRAVPSRGRRREAQRFDAEKVADDGRAQAEQGTLGEGELFSFEVLFQPNQDKFTADLYGDAFKRWPPRRDLRRRDHHRRRPQRSDGVPAREEGRRAARSCSGARSSRRRT